MKISTDNGPIRNMFGDVKAVEMIAAAGFDGIDYIIEGYKLGTEAYKEVITYGENCD